MILADTVAEKLKSLLGEMPSWKNLKGSQFVKMLGTYTGWAIEDAALKTERARHEAFIDTALNRSSILAHGEGMEFMPRKPVPATGYAVISNTGEYPFTVLRLSFLRVAVSKPHLPSAARKASFLPWTKPSRFMKSCLTVTFRTV